MAEQGAGLGEAERFDPRLITAQDLDDLASYTGLSGEACLARLKAYSFSELGDAWRRSRPVTSDELLAFYSDAEEYVWELMQWHASSERDSYREALAHVAEKYPAAAGWEQVLDFGCGVGSDALFLAARGYSVTLVDIDSPAFRFARHRFARRGLEARFIESRSMLPEPTGRYDIIVCFDVFEHLPDPLEAARLLVSSLRPGGLFVQRATFEAGEKHPCHLYEGVRRFAGPRWHINLAGLGLRGLRSMVYRRASGFERVVQRTRYAIWRLTGFWLASRS